VISLGVTFFLTPFIVRTLGDAAYGFWVVLLAFVGYAGILELGVQPAVVKLVGQYRGSHDREKLEELVTAAFVFFAGVGLLASLFVAFVLPPLIPRLVKEFHGFGRLGVLCVFIAADVTILFLNYLFAGILYGWQLYHVKNLIDITAWLLQAVLLLVFLQRGGLIFLAASKAATDLAALIATIALCKHTLPRIRPAFRRITRRSFKELLGFGGRIFVSATSVRISNYAQPLIISSQLSAAATAFFAIPVRIVDYARQIAWALATGFMPLFSELESRKEIALLRSIYLRYSRYIMILTLPVLILIFVYGRQFIGIWIGPEYAERGHAALYLLTAAALLEGQQPLLWRLFIGVGRLNLLVAISAAASFLAVTLSFLLVAPMGIAGVALSVLVTVAAAQIVFFWHSSRYLEIPRLVLFRQIQGRPLFIGLVHFGLTVAIARLLGARSYKAMLAGTVLSLLAYLPLVFISLLASERQWLVGVIRIAVLRRRRAAVKSGPDT
jgi:O-antigen/teichoic acid export membrane protein